VEVGLAAFGPGLGVVGFAEGGGHGAGGLGAGLVADLHGEALGGAEAPGLAAEVEDLGPAAEDGGPLAGLAGQASGLAGGDLLPGGGLGDAGGGEVGDQGVVVDEHDQGGGLAAVAGQVGLEDPLEEGDQCDALLAGQREPRELVVC
jgi:hypothetical protein